MYMYYISRGLGRIISGLIKFMVNAYAFLAAILGVKYW